MNKLESTGKREEDFGAGPKTLARGHKEEGPKPFAFREDRIAHRGIKARVIALKDLFQIIFYAPLHLEEMLFY